MAISLLVADSHEVTRRGVAAFFERSDVKVVGEAASGPEAVKAARRLKPDVVLLGVRMNGGDGLTALREIVESLPKTRVVMLSTFDWPTYVARSAALGAADYLLKTCTRQQLVSAIKAAHKGTGPTKAGTMAEIVRLMQMREPIEVDGARLTPREAQVTRHVALGLANKEIAGALGISIETVKEHVQNILFKLAFTDRTRIAVWATRRKLV